MSERSDADEPQLALVPYLGEYSHPRWYVACAGCQGLVDDDGECDQDEFVTQMWEEGWRVVHGALLCARCVVARAAAQEGAP